MFVLDSVEYRLFCRLDLFKTMTEDSENGFMCVCPSHTEESVEHSSQTTTVKVSLWVVCGVIRATQRTSGAKNNTAVN